jgi:putative transposase
VPQREVFEHQGAAGPEREEEAREDKGHHAGHHRSGRAKVNVDEADGVNGRHIHWQRTGFKLFWARKSRRNGPGRPAVAPEVRALIRHMSRANPLWGAPRIHGELQKLGIQIAQATVSKYLGRPNRPPSQTWRTFLDNHMRTLVSVDFFVVPTVMFKVLFVFVVLVHDRRRVVHINVTDAPTAQWTANQLVEAFPWETAPRYLLRDRDAVYGVVFSSRAQAMGIHEVKTAPRSPWQNPYVERLIGTLRRECLDHVVVLNETHLRSLLRDYLIYYHGARTHLALDKDAPEPRPVEPPTKARSSRRPWSAASIIGTPATPRRLLPAVCAPLGSRRWAGQG